MLVKDDIFYHYFALQHGDNMEIEDRLMFITASHATFDCAFPAVQRVGGASQVCLVVKCDVWFPDSNIIF